MWSSDGSVWYVRLDDATTSPHLGDTTVVQVPSVFLGGFSEQDESLGVRDDLGGVKGLLEVIDELLLVAGEGLSFRAGEGLGSSDSFILDGGQASRENGFTDQSDGATQVEGVDGGPLSGTLLTGLVEDLGDNGLSIVVLLSEDVSSDLDQERVKNALVPLRNEYCQRGNYTSVEPIVPCRKCRQSRPRHNPNLASRCRRLRRSTACLRIRYRCEPS